MAASERSVAPWAGVERKRSVILVGVVDEAHVGAVARTAVALDEVADVGRSSRATTPFRGRSFEMDDIDNGLPWPLALDRQRRFMTSRRA